MQNEILKLLYRNAQYTAEDLAEMLARPIEEVKAEIRDLEKRGVICGYKAVVDWDKIDGYVSAIVQLKVVPKANFGFEDIAHKIATYEEIESIYLTSGDYDLSLTIKGKTLQDIARFVAVNLATIDNVTATTTNFVMSRYKEMDVRLVSEKDDRSEFWI